MKKIAVSVLFSLLMISCGRWIFSVPDDEPVDMAFLKGKWCWDLDYKGGYDPDKHSMVIIDFYDNQNYIDIDIPQIGYSDIIDIHRGSYYLDGEGSLIQVDEYYSQIDRETYLNNPDMVYDLEGEPLVTHEKVWMIGRTDKIKLLRYNDSVQQRFKRDE